MQCNNAEFLVTSKPSSFGVHLYAGNAKLPNMFYHTQFSVEKLHDFHFTMLCKSRKTMLLVVTVLTTQDHRISHRHLLLSQKNIKLGYSYGKTPTICTISLIYFGVELYMFWTDLLSIISSLNNVYTAIGICHTGYVECLLAMSAVR
jgi:hypothetical protein